MGPAGSLRVGTYVCSCRATSQCPLGSGHCRSVRLFEAAACLAAFPLPRYKNSLCPPAGALAFALLVRREHGRRGAPALWPPEPCRAPQGESMAMARGKPGRCSTFHALLCHACMRWCAHTGRAPVRSHHEGVVRCGCLPPVGFPPRLGRRGQGHACLLAFAPDYLWIGGRSLLLCHVLLVCNGHARRGDVQ